MSDKRKYIKIPYAGKKNQQNCYQTSGKGSWLNLIKLRVTIKGIESVCHYFGMFI